MRRKIIVFKPFRQICQKAKRQKKIMDKNRITSICIDSWCSSTIEERLNYIRDNTRRRTGRSLQAKAVPLRVADVALLPSTGLPELRKLHESILSAFSVDIFYIDLFDNHHALLVADWTNHKTGKTIKLSRQDLSQMQDITADILGIDRGLSIADLNIIEKNLRKEIAAMELVRAGTQNLLGRLGMSHKDKVITSLKEKVKQLEDILAEKDKALSTRERRILQLEEYRENVQILIKSKDLEIQDLEKWKKNSTEILLKYEKILKRHGLLK